MEHLKKCPVCGNQVIGREDKKFCSLKCKNKSSNTILMEMYHLHKKNVMISSKAKPTIAIRAEAKSKVKEKPKTNYTEPIPVISNENYSIYSVNDFQNRKPFKKIKGKQYEKILKEIRNSLKGNLKYLNSNFLICADEEYMIINKDHIEHGKLN